VISLNDAVATYESLTESQPKILSLDKQEAATLRDLGKYFATNQADEEWDDEPAYKAESSVLECVRYEEADRAGEQPAYKVTVWNRVGAIQLGNRNFLIAPKIEFRHFAHIAQVAVGDPRTRENDVLSLDQHQSFRDLIARWFLNSCDRLIPNHLIRDYCEQSGVLPAVRGSVDPISTTRRLLSGRLDVVCRYDTFDLDHALNRVLREACFRVASYATLSESDRRRARAKVESMPEVGPFNRSDLLMKPDRRALAEGYGIPINLARSVLSNEGRSITEGNRNAYAFLQYTPSIIEEGLRNILRQTLGETWLVSKRSYEVQPLKSATPDLVFSRGGRVESVGDIKYKVVADWGKLHSDIYQSIYFATAAEVRHSLVVAFTSNGYMDLPQLKVGKSLVDGVVWDASPNVTPNEAQDRFSDQIRAVMSRGSFRTAN